MMVIPLIVVAGASAVVYGIIAIIDSVTREPKDREHTVRGAAFILAGVMIMRVTTTVFMLLYKMYVTLVDIKNILERKK